MHRVRKLSVRLTVATAAAAVTSLASAAAAAPTPPSPHPWGRGWSVDVGHRDTSPGRAPRPTHRPARPATHQTPDPNRATGVICGPWGAVAGCNGGGIAPIDLVQESFANLRLPAPDIHTAPPRCVDRPQRARCTTDGTVGLAQWFWLDPAQRRSLTKRTSAGPVWAELTASPQQITINPGPGLAAVTCAGGGTPYSATASPQTACTYTYTQSSALQPGSAYQVHVTVTWGGTWRGSGGAGGALIPISRTADFQLRIGEGQALGDGR